MKTLAQQGQFVYGPPSPRSQRDARGIPYRRFPGARPVSPCQGLDESSCTRSEPSAGCQWIVDSMGRRYCRGRLGSVSGQFPEAVPGQASVYFQPEYQADSMNCSMATDANDCNRRTDCQWISSKPSGREYCRGRPGTVVPYSRPYVSSSSSAQRVFAPAGRFNPGRYSREEKDTWYPMANETEAKYCRCVLESSASDVFGHGARTRNPWGICNASIAGRGPESAALRSQMAQFSSTGGCSALANFEAMPTELLYAYAWNRRETPRGRAHFGSSLPTVDEFLSNPEAHREILLTTIHRYSSEPNKQNKPVRRIGIAASKVNGAKANARV